MKRALVAFLLLASLFISPQAVHSAEPTSYSVGDIGPSGGYIAYKDEFSEYSWDYMEISASNWFSGGSYLAIRALPFGKNASSLTNLSTSVGSSATNTQAIITNFGDGWKISSISRDTSNCLFSAKVYCKVVINFQNPIGVSSFGYSPDLPTDLPISCSGQYVGNIVNTGEVFASGSSSIYFYENVQTTSLYQDINSKSDCKITYQALLASDTTIGGNSDWLLPSIGDLELVQKGIGADMASLAKKGYTNRYYPSSNFKDSNTQSLWGFYYDSYLGKKLSVDIKYSSYPILVRYFNTSSTVANVSYPSGCPSTWNPGLLVNTISIQGGSANGGIQKVSPKDSFEVIGKWKLEQSEDGINWNQLNISGDLVAETPKPFLSKSFYSIAAFGDFFRYRIEIEKKDCEKAILYSTVIQYSTTSVSWPRKSTIEEYVKNYPTKFPTFKEVDALNKSVADIRSWFSLFNSGTLSSCFLEDGTSGAYFFSDGETFGCKSDFENQNSQSVFGAVTYNWRTLRVLPVDPKGCNINNTLSVSAPVGIFVKTEFGTPDYNPGLWVTSPTTCKVSIFLYDDWGWYVLETLELKSGELSSAKKLLIAKAAAELKAKQETDAKAAAELKAKQEADAKAAAELKAKQEADAKAAAELKAKQEADAKAAAELKAKQEADAKAAAELKAKQEADAKAAAELKAKQEADARLIAEKVAAELKAKQEAAVKAAQLKQITITCVKGKLTKKITALKPVCPMGYKKKP